MRQRLRAARDGWLVWLTAALVFVIVGRIADLVPALYGVPLVKILTVLALLALLLGVQRRRRPHDPRAPAADVRPSLQASAIVRYAAAIVGLAALSLLYSHWQGMSFTVLTGSIAAIVALVLLVFKSALELAAFEKYLKALGFAGVALTVGGLLHAEGGRLSFGRTYDPNDLAFVLVALLPILLAFRRLSRGWRSLAWAAAAAGAVWVALLTQSRGGLIGLLLMVSYLGAVGAWRRRFDRRLHLGRVLAGWTLLAVLGAATFALLPSEAQQRYATILEPSQDYNVTAQAEGRLAIWRRGLATIGEYPWGVGVGAYPMTEMAKSGYWKTAHNSLLEITVELGLLGGVAFVLLYLRAWRVLGVVMARAVPSGSTARPRRRGRSLAADGAAPVVAAGANAQPVPEHWAIHAQHLRASLVGMFGAGFFISQAYSLVAFSVLAVIAGLEARYLPRTPGVRHGTVALAARLRRRTRAATA